MTKYVSELHSDANMPKNAFITLLLNTDIDSFSQLIW